MIIICVCVCINDIKLAEVAHDIKYDIKAEIRDKFEDLRGLLASNQTDCRTVLADPVSSSLFNYV